MDKRFFSPHIRVAMHSILVPPFRIEERIIFDYELILVSDGKCKITIDNTEYICKKNDAVFIRPGVHHKFECVDNSFFVQPHIHFDIICDNKSDRRFVSYKPKRAMSAGELSLIHEDVLSDTALPCVFVPNDTDKFRKIFYETIDMFREKPNNYELLCKSKMLDLLSRILSQFDESKSTAPVSSYNPVASVREYIDSNYTAYISLDSLSKQFYINKYTLLRKFKDMYNQSPMSYYRRKRLEYSKSLLRTTNLPITDIAEMLSFTDIYSFSRFFKTYTCMSPSEYRKKVAKA